MYSNMAKKEGRCSLLSVLMMVRDKAVGVFISEEVSHRHRAYDPDREVT